MPDGLMLYQQMIIVVLPIMISRGFFTPLPAGFEPGTWDLGQ
uniref:Uncharacterized protein n=1 Tax=Arundo donax TaxID=35708 RepID=A0A0A9BDX0_ARUDO